MWYSEIYTPGYRITCSRKDVVSKRLGQRTSKLFKEVSIKKPKKGLEKMCTRGT